MSVLLLSLFANTLAFVVARVREGSSGSSRCFPNELRAPVALRHFDSARVSLLKPWLHGTIGIVYYMLS